MHERKSLAGMEHMDGKSDREVATFLVTRVCVLFLYTACTLCLIRLVFFLYARVSCRCVCGSVYVLVMSQRQTQWCNSTTFVAWCKPVEYLCMLCSVCR